MATSTVLRVKRRLEDNHQDALVLVCKRYKIDSEEVSPSLFVFRGSVENEEHDQVKNIVPNNIKLKHSTDVSDIIQNIRKERKNFATENRYEIVNCSRGLKGDSVQDDFDLVDLQRKDEKPNERYIYDLYTSAKEDFDISMLDNLVSIENYETHLVLGSYRENGNASDDDDDSEDSNAENNWRNDYPDSEPSSIDEEDMIKAVENINIEDDLSSDVDEEKIYDEPPDLFNEDVKRYGAAYAKYKARVLSEQPDLSDSRNYVHCTPDDGYKDDCDDGFYYGQEEDCEQFREQYESDCSDPD